MFKSYFCVFCLSFFLFVCAANAKDNDFLIPIVSMLLAENECLGALDGEIVFGEQLGSRLEVLLSTQEEIDALEGVTKVVGSIRVLGNAVGLDFSPLNSLVEVDGSVIVSFNREVEIDGFAADLCLVSENLTIAGHNSNRQLTSFSGFENLVRVGGNIEITDNDQLVTLPDFLSLVGVGGNLEISGNPLLKILPEFTSLFSVGLNLDISENPSLMTISGFGHLASVSGNFLINGNSSLEVLSEFENLLSVGVGVSIERNFSLATFSGFDALIYVGGDGITVGQNVALLNFSGFNILSTASRLEVISNGMLVEFSGFGKLNSVTGSIRIINNNSLMELPEFEALISVSGNINIQENDNMLALSTFNNLEVIDGDLFVRRNDHLVSFGGFEGLTTLGYLSILGNLRLENLPEFPSLTTVVNSILIFNNDNLVNASTLSELEGVGGDFEIVDNLRLATISGFSVTVGGSVEIRSNAALDCPSQVQGLGPITTSFGNLVNCLVQ